MNDEVAAVEGRIGHVFADRARLVAALTHPSAADGAPPGTDYQRLEFLGDRVLGLAVSDMLYEAFPGADEGELSRRLADLVRKETCAGVAVSLQLGAAMIVGGGKLQRRALRTRNVLGDLCESVIAAIYLDGGFDAARGFVARNWRERMLSGRQVRRNAKTELQEWAQSRGLPAPVYEITGRSGPDHEPEFAVEARIESMEPAIGHGTSRRKAEQAAAGALLEREGIWPRTSDTSDEEELA